MSAREKRRARSHMMGMLLAVALAILLSGCAAPWPFPQPTPDPILPDAQQIMQPQQNGPNNGEAYTLDPALISFTEDVQLAQLLFPGLVTLNEEQRPIDWAAERHKISADGLTYTFHLHKGMQWSDGTPITADAFAYAINRTLDPCIGSDVATSLYPILGARAFHAAPCPVGALHSPATLIGASLLVPDPATLQIHLERPAAYFLAALASSTSWAVPQSLVERYTQPAVAQPYYPVCGVHHLNMD